MMKQPHRVERDPRRLWLTGALVSLLAAAGRAGADTIEFTDLKRQENIQIQSARWDLIQYTIGKGQAATSIPGERIFSITRDSTFLQPARDALQAGNSAKAISELSAVGSTATPWEQAEAKYLLGMAHLLAGRVKETEAAFKAYLDKYKGEKDWWVPHATQALAEMLLHAKQPGTAEAYFKELAQYKGQWELRSKLGQGQVMLVAQGEQGALNARRLFDEVSKSREASLALKQQAVLARSQAFLLQKQPQNVLKELNDEFFEVSRPGELTYSAERAEAALLMGKAYLALGGKENLEQAEIWLLRVPALFRRQGEVYTTACGLLADVYTQLNNKERASEWLARKQGSQPSRAAPGTNGGGAKGK